MFMRIIVDDFAKRSDALSELNDTLLQDTTFDIGYGGAADAVGAGCIVCCLVASGCSTQYCGDGT